jgi:hypothetical protein
VIFIRNTNQELPNQTEWYLQQLLSFSPGASFKTGNYPGNREKNNVQCHISFTVKSKVESKAIPVSGRGGL